MALIGMSGKIGSGKDTVGKIIQVICFLKKMNIPYSVPAVRYNWEKNFKGNAYYGDWHIKKFAGKLKETIVLLTGCTLEQLEDADFKKTLLGQEWEQEFKECTYDELPEETKSSVTNLHPDQLYKKAEKWIPTYRWLLQQVGTNAMRDVIHNNVWVNALFADYKQHLGEGWVPSYSDPDNSSCAPNAEPEYPNWIITDMRFPNELQAIQHRQGITIRINRTYKWNVPGETTEPDKTKPPLSFLTEHPSETALDSATFDFVIDNSGTIDELIENVYQILIMAEII